MNKKKLLALGATIMSAMLFASCTSPSKKVKFSENWYLDTTSSIKADVNETLTYAVTFEGKDNADTEYRALRYNPGVYTTTLVSEYSDELSTYVYRYTTSLEVSGEHECKTSGEIQSFEDTVTSEVVFTSAMQGLKPISSVKTFSTHTPTVISQPTSIEQCYTKYDYKVETTYDEALNGTSVQTLYKEGQEPQVTTTNFTARNEDYTTLDNEQVLFALRGMTSYSAQKFNVYNNSWKRSQLVGLSVSEEDSEEFSLEINGQSKKATISYVPLTIGIQENNSGSSQFVWIAKTTDRTNNTYRNVMLKFFLPVNNAYGTFEYTLTKANFI
ncbi:MAG: hypothetical protein IKA72_01130 [Clostridia bacterium]|nr:hypothetical protein [Clostridia bacterium]